MILPGLCSVTFRQLSPGQVIELAAQAGLRTIEWGGDIHVPHGDVEVALAVRDQTLQAGLELFSYGSYYRAAGTEVSFDEVLRSATALGARTIRVWAGNLGTEECPPECHRAVVEDLQRCSAVAADGGVALALEFHDGTLTDSNEAAVRLLEAVPGISIIWQPKTLFNPAYRREGLQRLLPWLSHLHVFQWAPSFARLPLEAGAGEWREYFSLVKALPGDRYALMEFVAQDSPDVFRADAAALLSWLR